VDEGGKMSLWILLLVVFLAGAVGGILNALMSDNGFFLPKWEPAGTNRLFRPGFLGNMLVSGISACISWGLYGPFAAVYILGGPARQTPEEAVGLTLSSLVGAVLIGVAGARWLTNEVDKTFLRAAASEAAIAKASPEKAKQIALSTPAEALRIAMH
jgi:hypothetical protein